MELVNFVTFVFLKILYNLFSMQITADVSEISKTVQRGLAFILNAHSNSSIHFPWFSIVIAKKNVVSFT